MSARPGSAPLRRARVDLTQRPFIVIWEATRACALACQHCRATAVPHRDPAELATAEAVELMAEVARFGHPAPFFVITGGDPFERPDLAELVAAGTGLGLPVAVSPSGTPALCRDNLTAIAKAGAKTISLSIDGSDADTHDAFRGVPGSHALTLRGWRQALDVGLKVQINTTVTPDNVMQLPDILRLIDELGALTWSLFFLVPTGRGSALRQLSTAQAEDVLNFCYDANRLVSLKTTEAPAFRRVCVQREVCDRLGLDPVRELGLGDTYRHLMQRLGEVSVDIRVAHRSRRPPIPVSSARGFVFISHTGDVYPSGFLPTSAGNVRRTSVRELYRSSPLFTSLRDPDSLHDRCGRCEFRAVCGGSRSRALAATADLHGQDPLCGYAPGSFGHDAPVRELLAAVNKRPSGP